MRRLVGRWIRKDGKTVADEYEEQINLLISTKLVLVASREGGWTHLYVNPDDNSYWESTYPHSEMHGGGPKTLTEVSIDDIRALYDLNVA